MVTVAVVDYGMGNMDSLCRAVEKCGHDWTRVSTPDFDLSLVSHLIIPGVGSYYQAMKNIRESGLESLILKASAEHQLPILGICLGMQILSNEGFEHEHSTGLGLIPGKVVAFSHQKPGARSLHVGWNEVDFQYEDPLFQGIESGSDFYFVHQYHYETEVEYVAATTNYGLKFPSIVRCKNIYGVQFHPEKSQSKGIQLIANFLNIGKSRC